MNSDFPRILTLLRKERGISQKQAAMQLGVSQALLSHYEKGIRECGLDFVVRVSDFYGVSCDYLLGRSPDPGRKEPVQPVEKAEAPEKEDRHHTLLDALQMLLTMTDRIGNQKLSDFIETYFSAAVYRMFRHVYRVQPRNEESLFTIPSPRAGLRAQQQMEQAASETAIMAEDSCGERLLSPEERERAALTTEVLTSVYGEGGSAMLALIRAEEEKLKK